MNPLPIPQFASQMWTHQSKHKQELQEMPALWRSSDKLKLCSNVIISMNTRHAFVSLWQLMVCIMQLGVSK